MSTVPIIPPGRLLPQHLADLRKSGLSDQQIAACGFYSVQAPATAQNILRRKRTIELGACLAIPFFDAAGTPTDYCRLRPDKPRAAKEDGKPIKYESPVGLPNRAYLPPATRLVLHDASVPLLITEGEKKSAKAEQEGFPCVALTGVYGRMKKRSKGADGKPIGEPELIPDLAAIKWAGRRVYIVFDSDMATNRNVATACWRLAETLERHGAQVKIVRLPAGESDADGKPAKVGLDDYLVAHGADAFRKPLETATDPEPPVAVAPIEAADDPHRLAKLYIAERCEHADGLTLRQWREQWRRWLGTVYRGLPDAELRAQLTASAKAEFDRLNLVAQQLAAAKGNPLPVTRKIGKALVTNIENALASLTVMSGTVEAPVWWDGRDWKARNLIALDNGLLDLDAFFAERENVLLPHSPRWFSPTCLPYLFDAEADCPRWQAFLDRNLEADAERINLLQEFFGLCLTPDTSRQRFVVLEGEGANGKSVVCAALEAMLGSENCSHVPLEVFGERFQLTPTIGKLANIASEVGELDKAAEGFLNADFRGGEID
jgi:putative DNA primase/helicase